MSASNILTQAQDGASLTTPATNGHTPQNGDAGHQQGKALTWDGWKKSPESATSPATKNGKAAAAPLSIYDEALLLALHCEMARATIFDLDKGIFSDPATREIFNTAQQVWNSPDPFSLEEVDRQSAVPLFKTRFAIPYNAAAPGTRAKEIAYQLKKTHKSNSEVNGNISDLESGVAEFPLTEIGNGRLFAKHHSAELRYCSTNETWYFHRGGIWQEDNHGEADKRAKMTAQRFASDAAKQDDDDKRARMLKHAITLTKRSVRETMLKDAMSETGMTVTHDEFDTDRDLFNCANGTLDLKTRQFWSHKPTDLLTRRSPVKYDPKAQCPLWLKCIDRWAVNPDTRDFIQEIMGVTLSGHVYEELFMFIYGVGDNGKTKFFSILEFILGTYFHKTKAETIMAAQQKRSANAPNQEIIELKGARLVTTDEVDEKHEFDTARIKGLTGRDQVTARGVYARRETTFLPQFTVWMYGNGKPRINDSSQGMWRRPKLIDFGPPIPKNERDPNLEKKLKAEISGILNWMLEGLARVEARNGCIETPDCVLSATQIYQQQQNPISLFFDDKCHLGEGLTASAKELFEAWCQWCQVNGEEPGKPVAFGNTLERQGLKGDRAYIRGVQQRAWRGISLTAPKTDTTEAKSG